MGTVVTIVNGKFGNNDNNGDVGSNGIIVTLVTMLNVIW
jgi:hypothetical protein